MGTRECSAGRSQANWALSSSFFTRSRTNFVKEALENDCTHIVFEQLKGVRERLPHAKAVHKWAFHRLYEYVTYKAESKGVEVKQINPEYTSQRCSKCGFTHEDNRPHKQ